MDSKPQRSATSGRKALLTPKGDSSPVRSGPRVVPPEAPAERSSMSLRLAGAAVAGIVIIVLAWTLLHVVLAVLHVVELVGIALLAGYIGFLAGVFHGRRTGPRS